MACKCLEEIPEAVKNACNEAQDYGLPVKKVVIENVGQSSIDKEDERLYATMKLYFGNKDFPKTEPNFFTYCPWCGVRYTEDV